MDDTNKSVAIVAHLPFLLSLCRLLLLLHRGGVRLLGTGLARSVRHIDTKHVNRVMVRSRRDISRVTAELQVVDLGFVSTTTEHEWARRGLSIYFPNADQCALFGRGGQQVAMPVESHGCDGSLMAHDHRLGPIWLRERSDFDVAFLGVGDGEHAGVLRVESA